MFGNGTKRKLLDKIFWVLMENVSFRSRIWFPKRIYSIFFGTKAAKQKLSILKERWFDIASNGNASETKANESFDIGVFFDVEAKRTPSIVSKLFSKRSEHIR
jgi:hypothetical protein